MYSWEIQKYLEERNYCINSNDIIKLIDIKQNPQISRVKFNPYNMEFEMWDKEGQYFKFIGMPYKEAVERGLVKGKSKDDEWER